MNATIRRAAPGDAAALAELSRFVHEIHVANRPSFFKPAAHEAVVARFRELLGKSESRIWIAEVEDASIGYVSAFRHERPENALCHARRWFEIDQISVRPDRRRGGVARALAAHVIEQARRENVREVELSCWCFNREAQETFRRLGFQPKLIRFERQEEP